MKYHIKYQNGGSNENTEVCDFFGQGDRGFCWLASSILALKEAINAGLKLDPVIEKFVIDTGNTFSSKDKFNHGCPLIPKKLRIGNEMKFQNILSTEYKLVKVIQDIDLDKLSSNETYYRNFFNDFHEVSSERDHIITNNIKIPLPNNNKKIEVSTLAKYLSRRYSENREKKTYFPWDMKNYKEKKLDDRYLDERYSSESGFIIDRTIFPKFKFIETYIQTDFMNTGVILGDNDIIKLENGEAYSENSFYQIFKNVINQVEDEDNEYEHFSIPEYDNLVIVQKVKKEIIIKNLITPSFIKPEKKKIKYSYNFFIFDLDKKRHDGFSSALVIANAIINSYDKPKSGEIRDSSYGFFNILDDIKVYLEIENVVDRQAKVIDAIMDLDDLGTKEFFRMYNYMKVAFFQCDLNFLYQDSDYTKYRSTYLNNRLLEFIDKLLSKYNFIPSGVFNVRKNKNEDGHAMSFYYCKEIKQVLFCDSNKNKCFPLNEFLNSEFVRNWSISDFFFIVLRPSDEVLNEGILHTPTPVYENVYGYEVTP